MSVSKGLESEAVVSVHRARDEWEGNILAGYLRDCGIEATCLPRPMSTRAAARAGYYTPDTGCDVFVIEHERVAALEHLKQFNAAIADEALLEEAAAVRLKLDKETIGRLRQSLNEERATFGLLGWLVVVFFVSAAFLWALWPSWMHTGVSFGVMRWVTVGMLMAAALIAGRLVGTMGR